MDASNNTAHPVANQGIDPSALELRDIHLPDPVSWWPIAPGWWLVLASLTVLIVIVYLARRRHVKKQLDRDIRAEIEMIRQKFANTGNPVMLARDLSVLLRRASISIYPTMDIAGLTGRDWLRFLDESHGKTTGDGFQSKTGEILLTAPYLPEDSAITFDHLELIALCESWLLSTHRQLADRYAPAPLSKVQTS